LVALGHLGRKTHAALPSLGRRIARRASVADCWPDDRAGVFGVPDEIGDHGLREQGALGLAG